MIHAIALVTLLAVPGHARLNAVGTVPKNANSILQCGIFDDQGVGRGQLMIFQHEQAGKRQVLDVQTTTDDFGLNGAAKSISEASGVYGITLRTEPRRQYTANTNGGGGSFIVAEGEAAFTLSGCQTLITSAKR